MPLVRQRHGPHRQPPPARSTRRSSHRSANVTVPYQLTPRDEVVLRLSHRQMGVGGDNCWGGHTHDEYKLFADRDYAYSYRLRPLTDVDEAMAASRWPTAVESAG
ncbi:hypothetical protein AB0945_43040 [Streptomyces sp. NPDC005474]|uniref:hypothetical protein n=1 Tax=Streptomyces sp. NPDC005474 TaxID=3154878 RepID=UPI003456CB2A